jgi:hypothetical protein
MSEFAAVAGLVAGTAFLIAGGLSVGTRYIDSAFSADGDSARARRPLVRPSPPPHRTGG